MRWRDTIGHTLIDFVEIESGVRNIVETIKPFGGHVIENNYWKVVSVRLAGDHGLTSSICRHWVWGHERVRFYVSGGQRQSTMFQLFPKTNGCQSVVFVFDDLLRVLQKGKKSCHRHLPKTPSDVGVLSTKPAATEGWRLVLKNIHSYQQFERP